jgi:hypothetical protein
MWKYVSSLFPYGQTKKTKEALENLKAATKEFEKSTEDFDKTITNYKLARQID